MKDSLKSMALVVWLFTDWICFFHLCGSQQASHKCRKAGTLVDSMAILNVFTPTQEECDKIQSGTVDTIPRELKLRILNEIPEVVRISVDMRQCVALLRGDRYVGTQQAKGQDYQFIIVQPATQLWRFTLSNLVGQMSEYMTHQFGLHVHFADLAIELPDSEPVMIQYTLLDLMT